jgi:hypothetical protein
MAQRAYQLQQFTLVKREITLYAAVSLSSSGTVIALQKWNYPTLGTGPNARTYTAAPPATALPSGNPYPLQYTCGAEGVRSIVRTGVGAWTVQLQDNYQRLVMAQAIVQTAAAGGLSAMTQVGIDGTLVNMATVGGSVFGLRFMSSTATAAEPSTNNDIVLLKFLLLDATEP